MKAIGYLLRLRCPKRCAFGIDTAPIPRDRHDFGMPLEPFGKARGGSIRKKVHDAVQVQVDEDRSIVLALAPSPIINAEVANGRDAYFLQRLLANAAQDSIVAGGDGQSIEESLARPAAGHIADQPYD